MFSQSHPGYADCQFKSEIEQEYEDVLITDDSPSDGALAEFADGWDVTLDHNWMPPAEVVGN